LHTLLSLLCFLCFTLLALLCFACLLARGHTTWTPADPSRYKGRIAVFRRRHAGCICLGLQQKILYLAMERCV
jgi:hypothetical protein